MKVKSESEVTQSCPTLSNPMDYSPPGSSIHGIFQARVLEWGANAFSDVGSLNLANNQNFLKNLKKNMEYYLGEVYLYLSFDPAILILGINSNSESL